VTKIQGKKTDKFSKSLPHRILIKSAKNFIGSVEKHFLQ
jgi:hypothetical protein